MKYWHWPAQATYLSEAAIYEKAKLAYIVPELREGRNEIQLAKEQ